MTARYCCGKYPEVSLSTDCFPSTYQQIIRISITEISICRHSGLPRFVLLCQFSSVSGSMGILTYFVMAAIEDIKKVLEEEIRP